MNDVLMLGGSGMLGSMVLHHLDEIGLPVTATTRSGSPSHSTAAHISHRAFDATVDDVDELLSHCAPGSWVVNAIGIIKPRIDEQVAHSRRVAIDVNAAFPHRLAAAAERHDIKVVQIATDCVYSGRTGQYSESASHDPLDVYGKSKSLGEVPSSSMMHLRVSIIGPELQGHASLLDWFRGLPHGAEVTGFDNHRWNGVTTLQYAQLLAAIVRDDTFEPGMFHVVPGDVVTKADMLHMFSAAFDRPDVRVTVAPAATPIDRTLSTEHPESNLRRWASTGRSAPPTVAAMITELANHRMCVR